MSVEDLSVHVATISRLLSDPSADGYDAAIDTALGALERVKMSTELLIASGAGKARRSHMISRCLVLRDTRAPALPPLLLLAHVRSYRW